ncbi:MAG: hypothetical protein JW731_13870 [Bacteroidales bacterium]|nr:hypothetical protein [Bacteroidales bacterium]
MDSLLMLYEQLKDITLSSQREQLQRTIEHAERKVDELVYGLYGLTQEEIEIIENN